MALDRPVHAPETADGTTARAVAAPLALGSVVHGGQTTPTDRKPWQTGSELIASGRLAPLPLLLIGLAVLAALLLTPGVQAQGQDSGSDFTLDAANDYPTGIWSDGTTMWVADFEDHKLYAYRMSDRSRDSGKDFTLDADNGSPVGIWSDGTTMWASDFTDAKLYAYRMSDRSRDSGKDFNTLSAAGNLFPEGIWSDGTTMWVADTGNDTVFAYDLSTRAWDFEKDITLAPGHGSPMGVWSNGSTMWVSDWRDAKLYAYRLSDQSWDAGKDFALDADDESYEGIWSAGSTMWVTSRDDDRLYAYDWNNPATGAPAITGAVRVDETLAAGTRSIADADGLDAAIFEYQWVSNDGNADTDIAGATDSTYTIVPGDRGMTIKVRVSFTDGAGNQESLTSEPTGRVGDPGICDRTPAVMAAIVAGMTGVGECSEVSETRLRTWAGSHRFGSDVTPGLHLQGRGLSALQAGEFRDLHLLRALDLNRNFLETAPEGLFEDLRAVEELYLSGNLLSELPEGLFDGQGEELSVLDLSANRLELMPEGVLRNLGGLVSLSLAGNGLSDLPASLFDDLARLEVLDLSANSINELPGGVFGGLGSLAELDLSGNKLNDLPAGLFEGLSGLTDLDAGDNPGAPFAFTAELERREDDTVVVRLAEGATPFDLQVELSALNGDLSTETVTIAAGGSYSDVVEVRAHGHHPVTIEIDSAAFLLAAGGSASGIRADRGSAMLMWIGRPLVQREWIQDGPFALHLENADPKSIWSDGETLWVGDESARKVFAYKLWDDPGTEASEYGTRDPGWDFPSLGDEDFYVTGHGARLYVAEESLDGASRDVFGYDLASFTRAEDRDFVYGGLNVAGGVFIVRGTATDGRHMWITNTTSHAHAFRLFDDPETPEDEYGKPDTSRKLTIPGRGQLRGLFTDGRTMWGVRFASNDASARSVKLSDGTDAGYDFTLHEDNDHAYGIWSNGETFYVVDADDAMIYTYHGVGGVVRPFVEDAETAAALVGNTGQSGDAGYDLGSAGAKRAQAFTTGTSKAGYALASVGIEFGEVSDTSSAPSDLEVTLNADGGGVPGDALCTLIAPANLSERSVNTFAAPASGTTCPVLEKETTYFVVVERVRVTGSGAIAVSGTASGSEDTGAAEGWSIADGSATYSPQAAAQGWASDAFPYKIEVRGSFINNPAAGETTVTGTPQVDETLTAATSGISDDDGLSNVSYSYQWIAGGLDIAGATGSSYTLTSNEQGKRIKVRVAFVDDRGNYETLTSEATPSVKAADRPGTVSLFPARPRVGTVVSASLSDPDGLEGGGSGPAASLGAVSWSWARSSNGNVWTRIDAYGEGDSYIPTAEDEGMLLKAEASYTDGHGSGKSAQAVSSAVVGAREPGPELTVTAIVTGLSHPWGIDFTPDGTMLFTQRAGVLNARLTDGAVKQAAADLGDLFVDGFAGLQALAVDPDFSTNRRFYTLQGHAGREMQVIAWTIDADYDEATRVVDPLVEGIPIGPGPWHSGGRLLFGPHGYLWIATGDGRVVTGAQDLTSLGGKVLRVDPQTGAGAPGNPFGASSPVYAYGFRNPQGLALRPGTDQMWLVEHGPKHDDEINLLALGGNYGWDPIPDDGTLVFYDYSDEAGVPMTDLAKFPSARQARWSSGFPTLETSGAVFLDGPQWGEWEGRLAVATLKTKSLRVFEFTEQGDFADQIIVPELDGSHGQLRTPVLGPDGALYIATSNAPGGDRILRVAANRAATGAPVISGTVQVGESLTAVVSGIADPDGLDDAAFSFQWVRGHFGSNSSDIEGATASTYTLVMADLGKTISVRVSFNDDWGTQETLASQRTVKVSVVACTVGEHAPAATAVEVQAVPAIVESTTEEYFVLYVRPTLDSEREFPVSVTLGEDGTTTLTEQLSPLPKEHYRVEKFLIADPADIDNDCIDDITELGDPVGMNPLNPARAVPFHDGAVAIPDRETFEALSYKGRDVPYHRHLQDLEFVKFYIIGVSTDNMGIYFMNTETHRIHPDFGDAIGLWEDPLWGQGYMGGEIIYHPNVVAPDGSLGVYRYQFQPMDVYTFGYVARSYEVLAASMPLLDDNLAYYPMPRRALPLYHKERALYDDSRINVVLREDILPDVPFLPLNVGEGYGFLRLMSLEERPDPRDVVIYETIPNELSRVAGLITTVPQTPLSHVNLRAVQDSVPNAFIRDALDDGDIDDLIGRYVHYSVTADGYSIRAATPAEVEAYFAASRPPGTQTPERDLTVTQITDLDDIGFDDWNAFGVKAANVAVLRTLGFPDGTVPDGFAVPFYFYDEFMKHNGFYDDVEEMLADPEFQSDYDTQEKELKKLRKKIKNGETPDWIIDALEEMHATYPEGQSLRYRSSTNNEDLPGFSGAGLYDSKTQDPEETEEDGIDKSIKGVWASLWNFRAFTEREFHRIDHMATAMGILVHPNYSDELANGVAVSFDPIYGTKGSYYVNTQLGEDLVTNPDAHSVPEEILLDLSGSYTTLVTSNQVPGGQLLLSDAQIDQLRRHLQAIHDHFEDLYNPGPDTPFAMEIEFKITSDDVLSIKQARPWVFGVPTSAEASGTPQEEPIWSATLTVGFGENFVGFTTFPVSPEANTLGALSPDTITLDDTSYTVRTLGVLGGKLILSVMPRIAAGFVLVVGTDEFVSTDASTRETDSLLQFYWNNPGLDWSEEEEVAVSLTEPDDNNPATGAPTITGTPQVDQTLTADTSAIADEDGLINVSYSYQWVRSDSGADTDIAGETDSTYTLVRTDEGKTIKVRVSFTDDADNEETLTSAATTAVAARPNTPATGLPTISGTAQVDETLTADTSGIADEDGLDNATFSYQWIRSDGNNDTDISGQTGSTYTLASADKGKTIKVRVSFTDDADNEETLTSAATTAVAARPNTPATGLPTISGTAQVDETLTADTSGIADEDGLDNATFSYQWIRSDGNNDTDISGQTGSTYTLVSADKGKTIKVRVSFTDDADNEETLTSAATTAVAARPNTPATGLPTISGTAQVDETLTADTSGIADEDGLDNATFSYQWIRSDGNNDTDISGQTGSTYTLVSADKGKTIKVRVSFTDDADNQETLTSAATTAVKPQPDNMVSDEDPAVWSADMLVVDLGNGSIGAVSANLFSNQGGSAGLQAKWLWYYTPGRYIRLSFTDVVPGGEELTLEIGDVALTLQAGDSAFTWDDVDVDWEDGQIIPVRIVPTSATAVSQPNSPATGAPTISGAAQEDETLTVDTSRIADADGLENVSYSYQWIRNDESNDSDIPDATDTTYTLDANDVGKTIKVRVTFTDDADNEETLTSAATTAVAARPNTPATGLPTISGTAQVDETLTADTSGIADEDGLTNMSYSYQWIRSDGNNDTDIGGQTGSTYTMVSADKGNTIKVRVSFTDDADNQETLTSAATTAVAARPNTPATGLPTISGTGQIDEMLTADTSGIADEDGLTNTSYSYQWIRSDGNNDTDIGGQTGSTYTLVSADKGNTIKVRVSFTDDADNQETLTSAATTAVAARPNTPATGLPTISGTGQVDEMLTADTSGIADEDGLDNATFSYQWIRNDGNSDSDIPDATDTTYTLVSADEGKTIKVRATFTDDADNEETLTSAATEVVQQGSNAWAATMTVETRDGFTGYSFWGDPHLGSLSATEVEWDGKTHYVRFLFLQDGELRLGLNEEMFSTGFVLSVGDEEFGSADAMVDKGGASYRFRWDDPGLDWSDGDEVSVNLVQSDQNTPALGPPTIRGTVQVDETLTADTSGVEDADGLTNVSYSYQWMADGVDIHNATSSTYKLVFPNQGKSIKVKVSFSDDADHEEMLTSNPTRSVTAAPNRQAAGKPTIGGTPQVDQTLTADTSNIADQDGLTNVSYSYQWIAGGSDIDGATGSSYELMSSEQGQTIQVRVTFTDDRDNAETLTSAATVAVVAAPNREATGLPTISGMPQVGETLTADISNIADEDGLDNVSYGYQWIRSDGDTDTEIAGETSSTYTVADDDAGKHVKVRLAFIDDAGNEESLTSGTTEVLVDYDADNDGLIEVTTLKQLDAIRHDLDGDGIPTDDGVAAYTAAFPGPVERMGCSGADGCAGYEIMADLDFDTNGSGGDDDGDTYWNDGAGWTPIGGGASEISTTGRTMHNPFLAIFEGNGRTISNLFVDKRGSFLGLFGYVGFDAAGGAVGVIRNVNLIDVNVTGNHYGSGLAAVNLGVITNSQVTGLVTGVNIVGGLVGENYGVIAGSHVAGCVSGGELVGGLVGRSYGAITNSSVTGCVSALSYVGGLVGNNYGLITGSHTAGRVSGHGVVIGGLVGSHKGAITASRSTARVLGMDSGPQSNIIGGLVGDNRGAIAASYATGHVSGEGWVGGLVGQSASAAESPSAITASYATGRVSGTRKIGGLVGVNDGTITASYAAGPVSGSEDVGGLAGTSGGAITASYWDTRTSGHPAGSHGLGKTTAELQAPTGYSGIYETWNLNSDDVPDSPWDLGSATQHLALAAGLEMDTDGVLDSLWDLGSASQYPALAADLDGAGRATWQEFGHQLRAGPVLTTTVTPGEDSVELSWTAVDTSHWSPVPTVTYTLYRGDGDTVEAIVRDLEGLIHTDDDVTSGETYSYQVVAVVAGGEAAHSALDSETPGVNAPATGAPTIGGTAQVDETLTVDTSAIADEDGLTNVSYSYQWILNDGGTDTDIVGETDSTYTLVSADQGKTIKVKVTFTDDADNEETLTSVATEVVQQVSNAWFTTMTVGTRDGVTGYSFWGDPHLGSLSVTEVEWDGKTHYVRYIFLQDGKLLLGLNEEMFSTGFVLSVGDEEFGSADAMVSHGGASYRFLWDDPGLGWSKGDEVSVNLVQSDQNTPSLGTPTISGTAQVDETLTADTTGVEDADGLTNVSYSYQWMADGVDIQEATSSTYKLVFPDQGKTIKVRVTFTDDRDNTETLTSEAAVAVVAAPNREATGAPTITGMPHVGQTLTADTPNIADQDGLANVSYSYQWIAGGSDIDGATGFSYELTSNEQGQTIQVRVTFTDDRDNAETLTSEATVAVVAAPNREATGLPAISGTPRVGETLTASTSSIADGDGLNNVSYRYQWIAGGTDIDGATGSSYELTSSEQGQTIQVRVTFTDDRDNEETLTSAATVEVAAAPVPLTVRLKVAAPTSHDGSSEFTFEIEFSEEFGLSYVTLKNHAFNVTGGSVERAQRTNKPSNISWSIMVKPTSTGDVTIELPATTDCGATGAICTGDDRKLSNSLSFTVSGPDG